MAKDEYILDEQVGYLLRLASQRHAAIFQAMSPEALTAMQFAALIRLGEHGELSQNRLGRLAAMDVATIKGVVDRLRQKELVEVSPDPDDRRRMLIRLSASARAMLDDLHASSREITTETLAPLSSEERAQFLNLLRRLT